MRLAEELEISKKLRDLFDSDSRQIWTGDLNALTRSDYSDREWDAIVQSHEEARREKPQSLLTEKVE